MKFISNIIKEKELEKIKNENLKKILIKLNKDLDLVNKEGIVEKEEFLSEDIKTVLKEKKGNNIIEYTKYINSTIKGNEIEDLFQILENEVKIKTNQFINSIYEYEKYNSFFEEEFIKAQKESFFDYSIISLVILDNQNLKKYEKAKKNCPHCIKKILYHGTQIDPLSKIISTEFKYSRKAFYGMGIYFSDELDYATFYSGGDNYRTRRINFNNIKPPNSTFTIIASEIFYDNTLLKHIRDETKYYVKDLDHFPTYEEIKRKYPDKMVPKNGIHFITVNPDHGHIINNSVISEEERRNGKFIGNEYVITELEQIFPIYGIKLKRNEYFVLWRDLNFEGNNFYTNYLKKENYL